MAKTADDLRADILKIFPSDHVYVNPPEDVKLVYTCWIIVFKGGKPFNADNGNYLFIHRYDITRISTDISIDAVDTAMRELQMVNNGNRQISEGLCHDYFTIFY